LRAVVHWERWIVAALAVLFVGSLSVLLSRFYDDATIPVPTSGGTYIEGSVGILQPLNPWFTVQNDVNRDIVSLVFSGLLKYNPETKTIDSDLADVSMSADGKIYTAKLHDDLLWHDSTPERPHAVIADDVVFTFASVQDQNFPSGLLRQNFRGVTIEKIDDRSVQFRLEEPYAFFKSNLTIGLLPKASFEGIPTGKMDMATDFGFAPVGAGPYRFKSLAQTELSTEVTLERFDRMIPPQFRLDRVVFRVFPDYTALLSDLRNLDGIRLVPHGSSGKPILPKRLRARDYVLPQYVSLFFNMSRSSLQDNSLRLGLQLGTNKQEISDMLGDVTIVDTPLLEIDTSDWRYHFDALAAQGALFESAWYFPEKIRLQRMLEVRETNAVGALKLQPVVLMDTGAVLTITGAIRNYDPARMSINGIPVQRHPNSSGTWIAAVPTSRGTGSLRVGTTLLRLTEGKSVIDSFSIQRTTTVDEFKRSMDEQDLVEQFVRSRDKVLPEGQRITVADMTLDHGYLRRRTSDDPVGVRINDRGEKLSLRLLTSAAPETYVRVAEAIQRQWGQLGVHVTIDVPATAAQFQDKLLQRDYDVLLFGQSLLDNLDSYPYWHSSGIQKISDNKKDVRLDAYNLSQYASFEADSLLETIRGNADDRERQQALQKLREVLKRDVPAIFLYSPMYTYAHREDILGIELKSLSLHSDRFLSLYHWYVKQERVFKPGMSWMSFLRWLTFGSGE
jgi:ABC-type transport system substrate-binding protein